MTNKEFRETQLTPEQSTHCGLLKFYSCLADLSKWNEWLYAEYDPEDPIWLHANPDYCFKEYMYELHKKSNAEYEARKATKTQ